MQRKLEKPRVVILGAGFGGLTAAKAMAEFANVTLVDRHNFQTFLPLLYQVSTAGLAADMLLTQSAVRFVKLESLFEWDLRFQLTIKTKL
jgi:NADH dehydrogenase FAD-containing subunit